MESREGFSDVDIVGAKVFPPDSDVGFATAILKKSNDARRRLKAADDVAAYRAFIDAATIAQDFDLLHLEFGMASWLGPGRKQAAGRRNGGLARALEERPRIEARHAAWCAEDATRRPGKHADYCYGFGRAEPFELGEVADILVGQRDACYAAFAAFEALVEAHAAAIARVNAEQLEAIKRSPDQVRPDSRPQTDCSSDQPE